MHDDFPLVIPPAANPEAQIMHRKADRASVGYFQRAHVAKVLARLNNTLQDAAVHVAYAPMLWDAPKEYRMMNYGARSGGMRPIGAEESEGRINFLVERKKVFVRWRKAAPQNAILTCEDFCQRELSLYAIREKHNVSWDTAMERLQVGLNEYAIAAGWGDQINGRP
ncbi:hypothetical protein [Methylobacterium sp. 1030]|uniref:hypothetical protein n=1 Tax=Methylobacterium sp. 1030 TaxID=3156404 RepID=UPI003391706F